MISPFVVAGLGISIRLLLNFPGLFPFPFQPSQVRQIQNQVNPDQRYFLDVTDVLSERILVDSHAPYDQLVLESNVRDSAQGLEPLGN